MRRFAWPVLILVGVVSGILLDFTVETLRINTSTEDMIDRTVEFRRNDIAFDLAFPARLERLVVVLEGPSPEESERGAELLAEAMRSRPEWFSGVVRPGTFEFFRKHALLYLSLDELSAQADRLAEAAPLLATLNDDPSLRGLAEVISQFLEQAPEEQVDDLDKILARIAMAVRRETLGEPGALSWRRLLVGEEAEMITDMAFVTTQPKLERGALQPAGQAIAVLRTTAEALGLTPERGFRMRLTGPVAIDHEELESVKRGGELAGFVSLVAVTLLLAMSLRSLRLLVAVFTTLTIGLLWTAAFAAAAVGQLNLISVAFAVLFVGLGVDFGIHFSLRFAESRAKGAFFSRALREASRGTGRSLALSALCAAIGFLAFLPTDYRGLAELGLISAGGMAIALIANLTLLPALMAILRPHPHFEASRPGEGALTRFIERRGRWVSLSAIALGAVAAAFVPFVSFDMNPLNLKDQKAESVAAFLELAQSPETTPYSIEILAPNLSDAETLATRLRKVPGVGRVLTLLRFVPEEQKAKLAIVDDMAFFLGPLLIGNEPQVGPDAKARADAVRELQRSLADSSLPGAMTLARALSAFIESRGLEGEATDGLQTRLLGTLPRSLETLRTALNTGPVDLSDLPFDLRDSWIAPNGSARVEVFPAEKVMTTRELRDFAEAVEPEAPLATGTPVVITEAGRVVLRAFVQATLLALVGIVAVLWVTLRRPRDIALVLLPLLLAALWTVATSVILGLPFNFANVIVLPLLLGLGVASGIHLVLRRRESGDGSAIMETSTPRAVLFSALTTIASFGSLAVSGHRGMASMGELLTLAVSFTLLAMLVVLPSFMSATERRRD